MKTKELKNIVEENGYDFEKKMNRIYITKDSELVIQLTDEDIIMLNHNYVLQTKRIKTVMKALIEYSETPIEEREGPNKFYVKPKGMKIESDRTFNYHIFSNTWYLLFLDGMSDFKTQFTLEELKELGVPIEHYDLEGVKE